MKTVLSYMMITMMALTGCASGITAVENEFPKDIQSYETPVPPIPPVLAKGYAYLEYNLNPDLNLICESADDPNTMLQRTYWLINDNFLASLALKPYNPDLSARILAAIEKYGYRQHYLGVLNNDSRIDPVLALDLNPEIIEENGEYVIKAERLTDNRMEDYAEYFDKLCYKTLWHYNRAQHQEAADLFSQALEIWDGKGFKDKAFKPESGYCNYKLALFYITAKTLDRLDSVTFQETLLSTIHGLQAANGGFHTFYSFDNQGQLEVKGSTNTETTSLVLLALR